MAGRFEGSWEYINSNGCDIITIIRKNIKLIFLGATKEYKRNVLIL
jgi:hypothetical protein